MGEVHGNMARANQVPDADIDALMAQIRRRVCMTNQVPVIRPAGADEGAAAGKASAPAEAAGAREMQREFNAIVTQALSTIMEQFERIQQSLAALTERSSALSASAANGEARHQPRTMDAVGARTVPYVAHGTNGSHPTNGHANGV
jgi:hypothetical protein